MAYKNRWPNTFEDAITKIAGARGTETAALDAGKKTRRPVYDWMDPDIASLPTVLEAAQMDAAYMAATGDRAPILKAYETCLSELTRTVPPQRIDDPLEAICATVREATEGCEAWRIHHERPSADTASNALREIQEGIDALQRLAEHIEAEQDKTVSLHDRKRAG